MTILIFLVLISALVFIHELGHFILAKRAGIRVDEFAIGFPPKIFSWKRGETTYAINALPIGGYVKILGEDGENADDPRSFVNARRHRQAAILAAGVAFNWISAFLAFWVAVMIGVQVAPGNPFWEEASGKSAIVVDVLAGSPAETAGLVAGDRVESVGSSQVLSSEDVVAIVSAAKGPITVAGVHESGEQFSVSITPTLSAELKRPVIGTLIDGRGEIKLGPIDAVGVAARYTAYATGAVPAGLWSIITDAFHGAADAEMVSGPVGIAVLAKGAAEMGWGQLLAFAATISINLAIINLAPLPALDGGRLVVVGIESVVRRRIPTRYLSWINLLGFVLLLALMAAITVSDVRKFF